VFVTFSKNVSAEVSYRTQPDKGKSGPFSSNSAAHVSLSSYSNVKKQRHNREVMHLEPIHTRLLASAYQL
ncbi:MAG: hypothetical protein AAFO70_04820, partial [Pseudomonadota bacterium]